jgi:hypothetical protein
MFANVTYHILVEFALAPVFGDCDGILAWHINNGEYGGISSSYSVIISAGFAGDHSWLRASTGPCSISDHILN